MLRVQIHRYAILAAAVAGVNLGVRTASAQTFPVTQIVKIGLETPETGVTYDTISTSPMFSLNARGDVIFGADLAGAGVIDSSSNPDTNSQALYLYDGATGQITKVVRRSDELTDFDIQLGRFGQGTSTTSFSTFVGTSSLNIDSLGNAVFKSTLRGLDLPTTADSAYFMATTAGRVPIMREGGDLPASAIVGDMDPTWRYGDPNFSGVVNNGRLVFYAPVTDAGGSGVGTAFFSAASATDVTTVVFADAAAGTLIGAGPTPDRVTALNTSGWRVNSDGVAIFGATLNGTTNALIRGSATDNLKILAKAGDESPLGAGVNYAASFLVANARNVAGSHTAFMATLTGAGVDAGSSSPNNNNTAIFIADATDVLKTLVRENDAPAGQPNILPTGATQMRFASLANVRLSPSGWMLFGTQLRANNATSETGSTSYEGLYAGRISPDTGLPELVKVAQESDTSSFSQSGLHFERGAGTWTLDRWYNPSGAEAFINSEGKIVFFADGGDSGGAELTGLFYFDPTVGKTFSLVVEGSGIMLDEDGPGAGLPSARAIKSITTTVSNADGGSDDGGRTLFNTNKQVAFQAELADGTKGVFRTDVDDYLPVSSHVWTAGTGNWADTGNWAGGPANGEKTYAQFQSTDAAAATVTLDGPKVVGEVFINRPGKLTLTGGALVMEGLGDRGYIGVAQGSHEIASDISLNDTASVIVDGTSRLDITGVVTGAGDLRKGGPGTLKLTNANGYTGNTVIAAGYLETDNTNQLGAAGSKIILDGGVLRYMAPMTDDRDMVVTAAVRRVATGAISGMQGGIDVGVNDVTLTGDMSFETTTADGFIFKTGAGKLTLALSSGGPGGVQVQEGALEVTTPQTWGNGYTQVASGASLHVASTGSISGTGALWNLAGAQPMVLDGPVNITGIVQASGNSTTDTRIDINAPSSFGNMTATASATITTSVGSVINVNANTTVSGTVNIVGYGTSAEADYNRKADINVAPGVSFAGGTFSVSGILNVPATASVVQTGTAEADRLYISSSGILNLGGSMSVAGDLEIAGLLNKPASLPISVGDDLILPTPASPIVFDAATVVGDEVRLSNKFNFTLTSAGSLTAKSMSIDANDAATGGTATFNGPVTLSGGMDVGRGKAVITFNAPTTVGGVIAYDVISNGGSSVTFANAASSSGGMDLYTSTSSSANTQAVTMTIAATATHTTGNITLRSHRSSATGTSVFAPTVGLTVDGSLDGGHLLMRASENMLDKNNATTSVNVSGTLKVKSIRHDAYRNSVLLAVPDIDIEAVNIGGLVEIKRSDAPGGNVNDGTSVLLNVPTFTGTGKMNLWNNALLLKNADTATPASVAAKLAAAQTAITNGAGGGAGFISSVITDDPHDLYRNLVAFRYGDSGLTATTFRGQPVLVNDIVVLPELYGDADYSGVVNAVDYLRMDRGYLLGLTGWINGDIDGDGVDGDDYFLTDKSFVLQGAPAALAASPVPEPAAMLWLGLGAASLLVRRRRTGR